MIYIVLLVIFYFIFLHFIWICLIKKKKKKNVTTGSANINDRSLLGDRDSELCTVTTDNPENCITVKWNGEDVQVGGGKGEGELLLCIINHQLLTTQKNKIM